MKRARILAVLAAAPLAAAGASPRLLLTPDDFARIDALAARAPWASSARSGIVAAADQFPDAHNRKYFLSDWKLPPEGGQWTHHYVCPTHGVGLQTRSATEHVCRVDNKVFTGWPYDQVIYSYRHSDNAAAARDNGLAFRFTGDPKYARAAARILLAYAEAYLGYRLKNTQNQVSNSAGRAFAQTLDEAVWLIPMAWAYDLVAESGVLSPSDRARIEDAVLRAAVAVIQRNNAGVSNWQSWHNAAIGAVGFALDDPALIRAAIDGPSGFRFQMRNSVLEDGTWYEGAWSYHFYALDPLVQLAEMAARAGIDLWAEKPLRGMFEAPLRMAGPDRNLPPFNDSGPVSLIGRDSLFEPAYARYRDPALAQVLGQRSRGREALFWGADVLPEAAAAAPLGSAVFPASGYAMLRTAENDHYIAMKFGPHGGGHGHYDKLGFVSYARGTTLAVDPGTQPYAAPTHETWDKLTVAHNTLVVDESTQAETTGKLLAFAATPGISAVRASAGAAYKQAALERTMILTPDYAIDVMQAAALDSSPHRFDLVYHNNGKLSTDLPLALGAELPRRNGYQHLTSTRSADIADDWHVDFDLNDPAASYGSLFASPSTIPASFTYARGPASGGSWSGRMDYDFTAAQGYVVYTTPVLAVPAEVPSSVALMIYGDGSGHKLTLRIYDSTDERFVYTVGPVDWLGWREIRIPDPSKWGHYLGDENGTIDVPIRTVAIEIGSAVGKPPKGSLFVDDIRLGFSGGERVVADFERTLRSLRVAMLAAAGTRVVTGDGLGPDLLKPVPFVMARRQGTSARFVSLLEPFGERPEVTAFRSLSADAFLVAGDGFEDRISFDDGGALRLVRRRGGDVVRVAVAGVKVLAEGGVVLLEAEEGTAVQVDFREGGTFIEISGSWNGILKVLAPNAGRVLWNGAAVPFQRDGDSVTVAPAGV